MEFSKPTREQDEELRKILRKFPCFACLSLKNDLTEEEWEQLYSITYDWRACMDASDPDHITTRGAGGGDELENLTPLCREHHNERHDKGLGHMVREYSLVATWFELQGRADVFERAGMPVPETCKDANYKQRKNGKGKREETRP